MKVLFIVGSSRSGTTLLGNILGSIEGFCHVGELQRVWQKALQKTWLCGCGKAFNQCPFWSPVLQQTLTAAGQDELPTIEALRDRVHRQLISHRGEVVSPETRRYEEHLGRLLRAVGKVSGQRVIVDSSKTAAHGWSLERIEGVELWPIHLVRDPRAVAFSWARKKRLHDCPDELYMNQRRVDEAVSIWNVVNQRAEWLLSRSGPRALRLRYEDLAQSPKLAIQQLLSALSESGSEPQFSGDNHVSISPCHSASGNPDRFGQNGLVEIKPDNEWQSHMESDAIRYATQAALDRLKAYGYISPAKPL